MYFLKKYQKAGSDIRDKQFSTDGLVPYSNSNVDYYSSYLSTDFEYWDK